MPFTKRKSITYKRNKRPASSTTTSTTSTTSTGANASGRAPQKPKPKAAPQRPLQKRPRTRGASKDTDVHFQLDDNGVPQIDRSGKLLDAETFQMISNLHLYKAGSGKKERQMQKKRQASNGNGNNNKKDTKSKSLIHIHKQDKAPEFENPNNTLIPEEANATATATATTTSSLSSSSSSHSASVVEAAAAELEIEMDVGQSNISRRALFQDPVDDISPHITTHYRLISEFYYFLAFMEVDDPILSNEKLCFFQSHSSLRRHEIQYRHVFTRPLQTRYRPRTDFILFTVDVNKYMQKIDCNQISIDVYKEILRPWFDGAEWYYMLATADQETKSDIVKPMLWLDIYKDRYYDIYQRHRDFQFIMQSPMANSVIKESRKKIHNQVREAHLKMLTELYSCSEDVLNRIVAEMQAVFEFDGMFTMDYIFGLQSYASSEQKKQTKVWAESVMRKAQKYNERRIETWLKFNLDKLS